MTSHPDPPEVHGLSNQLIVLGHFFLGGKLHKAFTDLSTQTESTKMSDSTGASQSSLRQFGKKHAKQHAAFIPDKLLTRLPSQEPTDLPIFVVDDHVY